MNAPLKPAGALTPSVAATLEVLAAEIELAGARCMSLDRLMGEVMAGLRPADRVRLLEGMHGVDLLAQHLMGLSAFAREVSAAAPVELTVPVDVALSEITLGALAERIAAGLGAPSAPEFEAANESDSGDVDLF